MADDLGRSGQTSTNDIVRDDREEEFLRDLIRELKKMNLYLAHMNDFVVTDEDVEV
jgi:hypothetical protein